MGAVSIGEQMHYITHLIYTDISAHVLVHAGFISILYHDHSPDCCLSLATIGTSNWFSLMS